MVDYSKAFALLNRIAAIELGVPKRPRRKPDPHRNKLQKIKRLAKRENLSLRDALDKYNKQYHLENYCQPTKEQKS
jgi:hypothetical protein